MSVDLTEPARVYAERLECWSSARGIKYPATPFVLVSNGQITIETRSGKDEKPNLDELLRISDDDLNAYSRQKLYRNQRLVMKGYFVDEEDTLKDVQNMFYITKKGVGAIVNGEKQFFLNIADLPQPTLLKNTKRMRK